ncbi:MAG TPA: glutamate synthase central domain-containing protein, partial [Actinomycetota bacterium]|nr:glutamate synthase central domain-containing protein [Actinomycetota bacterium]
MRQHPAAERDACGIGFVADARGRPSRQIVEAAVQALCRVVHRGAVASDELTGDGSGILAPIPRRIFGEAGVAMVFSDGTHEARGMVESAAREEGLVPVDWREVPVDPAALGKIARESMPVVQQLLFEIPDGDAEEAERRCYRARRRAELAAGDTRVRLYVPSWSTRTVTYKALSAATQLANFYSDLADDRFESAFAIFHQRYSTNTRPTWERAQPFRMLCHNGEVNTIAGNVNWMRAREGRLGGALGVQGQVVSASGSDSSILDEVVELLVRGGRDVRHSLSMLVPAHWDGRSDLDEEVRGFFRYHSCLVEPWDGPAGIVFTDGVRVGACLDRNGLRPLRTQVCQDGLVVVSSEVGTVDVDGRGPVTRGRLEAGAMLCVDPGLPHPVQQNSEVKRSLATIRPFGQWARRLTACSPGSPAAAVPDDLTAQQVAFGFTREELAVIVEPMAKAGKEPVSSMGDDTQEPFLSPCGRPVFAFLKQRFAQVTNPPIDHLRERLVMSLRTLAGPRAPLLEDGPQACDLLEFGSFFVFPEAVDDLFADAPWPVALLDSTYEPSSGSLGEAVTRLSGEAVESVRAGAGIVVVSDRACGPARAPIPSVLAAGAVHHALMREGLRTCASVVVDSGEPRETHHFACLLGYGADLVCPRLALATIADRAAGGMIEGMAAAEALTSYRTAAEDGVLKIMSKMGISTLDSYRGAQLFEAVGLGPDVIHSCLTGTPSLMSGLSLAQIHDDVAARHAAAYGSPKPALSRPGFVKHRPNGEYHHNNPGVVETLHDLVGAGSTKR